MAATTDTTFSVMTLNIWRGGTGYLRETKQEATVTKVTAVLRGIATHILQNAREIEVLALQEVDRNLRRSFGLYTDREILGRLGGEWQVGQVGWFSNACNIDPPYREDIEDGHGKYGNTIFSKFNAPIVERLKLGRHETNQEERSAVCAQFQKKGHTFWVISLHLGLTRQDQMKQLTALVAFISEKVDRAAHVILCGDFNIYETQREGNLLSYPELKTMLDLSQRSFKDLGPSGQNTHLLGKIDYVFFSQGHTPHRIQHTAEVVQFPRNLSDHHAIKVTLKIDDNPCPPAPRDENGAENQAFRA